MNRPPRFQGLATALAFAREGGAVAVNDRTAEKAETAAEAVRTAGGRALPVPGDVSRDQECRRIVAETITGLGGLDILVNNAGTGASGTVLTTDEETWDRLMAVNLKSVFLMSKAALAHMVPRRSGVIVNAGSIAGVRAIPDRAAYVASKFGVVGLTRTMALDHVKDGIRVNCVCPGTTETPWIGERLQEARHEAPDPHAAVLRRQSHRDALRAEEPERRKVTLGAGPIHQDGRPAARFRQGLDQEGEDGDADAAGHQHRARARRRQAEAVAERSECRKPRPDRLTGQVARAPSHDLVENLEAAAPARQNAEDAHRPPQERIRAVPCLQHHELPGARSAGNRRRFKRQEEMVPVQGFVTNHRGRGVERHAGNELYHSDRGGTTPGGRSAALCYHPAA